MSRFATPRQIQQRTAADKGEIALVEAQTPMKLTVAAAAEVFSSVLAGIGISLPAAVPTFSTPSIQNEAPTVSRAVVTSVGLEGVHPAISAVAVPATPALSGTPSESPSLGTPVVFTSVS